MLLTNSFHNSRATTRATRDELNRILDLAPWDRTPKETVLIYRINRQLCGVKGCVCGQNELGER